MSIPEMQKIFFPLEEGLQDQIKGYLAGNRRIPLIGEISKDLVTQVSGMLLQLDYVEDAPVTLLINTPGGSVEQAYHLHDTIRALNSPVDGLVIGKAFSVGVDILQMCRNRHALPMSRFFCHFTRIGGFELIDDGTVQSERGIADSLAARLRRYREAREKLYRERTEKTTKEIRQLFRMGEDHGIDMSADEAKQRGLIDAIVTDFKFFPGRHRKSQA